MLDRLTEEAGDEYFVKEERIAAVPVLPDGVACATEHDDGLLR